MNKTECIKTARIPVSMFKSQIEHEMNAAIIKLFQEEMEGEWIKLSCNAYYVPSFELLVADPMRYACTLYEYENMYFGFPTIRLDEKTTCELFCKSNCPFVYDGMINGINQRQYVYCNGGCIKISTGEFRQWNEGESAHLKIPIVALKFKEFAECIIEGKFSFTEPDDEKSAPVEEDGEIDDETGESWLTAATIIGSMPSNTLSAWISAAKELDTDFDEDSLRERIIAQLDGKTEYRGDKMQRYIDSALSADYHRAEIEKYDSKCVEDVNRGNWEFWSTDSQECIRVELEKTIVARNPLVDIREDGIIGIDFGTKSTIVSCQDGNDRISLLRIGMGQLSKKEEKHHYENPTVMEFIDLETFLSDYFSQEGRPLTSIETLTVSHKAANSLNNNGSSDSFYSYFYDIKQWCGQQRQIKIVDQKGNVRILPPYLEIEEESFDPVEIYAYYLGLFINNMRNGIYLDYVLSFPVAYSVKVRQKLLKSFERGLKKSLPQAVIDDEQAMQSFHVQQGISEPAAYAICALKNYGFDPEDDDRIFYGIFDFGGGTTDFDFGIWRSAKDTREERRYDYVINHFGSGGDKFLGGENLLEMLAYELLKANRDKLYKNENDNFPGISFCRPVHCSEFSGSETLVSESQEARRNIKQVMEKLRPIWEGLYSKSDADVPEGERGIIGESGYYADMEIVNLINSGVIEADLFDNDGKMHGGFKLVFANEDEYIVDFIALLEERIYAGVKNFFEALKLTFKNEEVRKAAEKVHIFLAGNSSKSPILHKCFDRLINEHYSAMSEIPGSDKSDFYELYPALGSEFAVLKQSELGEKIDDKDILLPTGKTGVAYGLIEGREGGKIKVISEKSADAEIKFAYYLGRARKGKFVVVADRNIEYNKWFAFIDAGSKVFEIYYSTLPSVTTNRVDISEVRKKRLEIASTDDNADVFIRAVSPTEIEYASARSIDDLLAEKYLSSPRLVDISQ